MSNCVIGLNCVTYILCLGLVSHSKCRSRLMRNFILARAFTVESCTWTTFSNPFDLCVLYFNCCPNILNYLLWFFCLRTNKELSWGELISAQKWYISCVNLSTLVICFASYLRKSYNLMQLCLLCFRCLISPIYAGNTSKDEEISRKMQRDAKENSLKRVHIAKARNQQKLSSHLAFNWPRARFQHY